MEQTNSSSSYKEELVELRSNLKQMLPSSALTSFDDYAEELQRSIPNVLKVRPGDQAPNFTLSNYNGNTISLSGLLKSGQVVLVFYRGAWCPYCNLQLNILQNMLGSIKAAGANLVAISPQVPDVSMSMVHKNNFEFEVLSDVGSTVAKKFTTVYKHADKATQVINSLGIDFESHYGDDSYELPVPAVFVINQKGIISFAKSEGGDFRSRVEPSEILSALTKNISLD